MAKFTVQDVGGMRGRFAQAGGAAAVQRYDTVNPFTDGSVPFARGGALAEDNAAFFWNRVPKRLGIGTTTPSADLDIRNAAASAVQITAGAGFPSSLNLVVNALSFILSHGRNTGLFSIGDAGTEFFFIDSAGRFGFNIVPDVSVLYRIGGTLSPSGTGQGLRVNPTINAAVNGSAYIARISGTIVEAASGAHPVLAGLIIDTPTITPGAATSTLPVTLHVGLEPTGGKSLYVAGLAQFAKQLEHLDRPKYTVFTAGGGTALLGAGNCPAVTLSAPYCWLDVDLADGSRAYSPVWK